MKLSFSVLVVVRILEGLLLRTAFNPDEHWQANEVAHHLVFGDSVKPRALLTWEWLPGSELRGWAHPGIFALLYKILAIVGLDSRWMVAWGPRILQSIFAAVGDLGVLRLGGLTALKLQLVNWFIAFCLPRTYSNSLETVLFTWSLVYYLKQQDAKKCFLIAAATLLMRPTAAVLYIPVGTHYLFVRRGSLLGVIPGALVYLVLTMSIDYIGYDHCVFVPWNFVRINSLLGVSSFYGTHPIWWYWITAWPLMLWSHLGVMLAALSNNKVRSNNGLILTIIAWATCVYSLNSHKEFRFVLPLMPLTFVVMADWMNLKPSNTGVLLERFGRKTSSLKFLFITNIIPFVIFGMIHQAGPDSAVSTLVARNPKSILFLMGCHQTQFAAHFHNMGVESLRQLDCSPTRPKPSEVDRFYFDPVGFTKSEILTSNVKYPSHIVAYDDGARTWNALWPFLKSKGYAIVSEHPHQIFGDERSMIVLQYEGHK